MCVTNSIGTEMSDSSKEVEVKLGKMLVMNVWNTGFGNEKGQKDVENNTCMFCVLVDNRSREIDKKALALFLTDFVRVIKRNVSTLWITVGDKCIYLLPDSEFLENAPAIKRKSNYRYAWKDNPFFFLFKFTPYSSLREDWDPLFPQHHLFHIPPITHTAIKEE